MAERLDCCIEELDANGWTDVHVLRTLRDAKTVIDALEKRVKELEAERDQARAKAIGECEKIAAYGVARAAHDYHNIGQQEGAYMTATDILISIRSLNSKQTPPPSQKE